MQFNFLKMKMIINQCQHKKWTYLILLILIFHPLREDSVPILCDWWFLMVKIEICLPLVIKLVVKFCLPDLLMMWEAQAFPSRDLGRVFHAVLTLSPVQIVCPLLIL